jgi:hypothetical protein
VACGHCLEDNEVALCVIVDDELKKIIRPLRLGLEKWPGVASWIQIQPRGYDCQVTVTPT